MKDYLQDIVAHTHSLGFIDLVKITGDASTTTVEACPDDRSVIIQAQFKNPVPEFVGTFGMPNLGKLNTILNIPEYNENAKLSIAYKKDEPGVPEGIHFENKTGDFKNDYRFMTNKVVSDKLKTMRMKPVKWSVEITPTVASIQRLKFQASANSEEQTFKTKVEGQALKMYFGDHSSHAGDFVFADNITGTLTKSWAWPVSAIISILNLPGDKALKISDEGVIQVTVDSGIAIYNYMLPAHQK